MRSRSFCLFVLILSLANSFAAFAETTSISKQSFGTTNYADWARFNPYKFEPQVRLVPSPKYTPLEANYYLKHPAFPNDPTRSNIIFGRGTTSLPTVIYARAFEILQIGKKYFQAPAAGYSKYLFIDGQSVTIYGTSLYTPLPNNKMVANPAQISPFDPTRVFYRDKDIWPSVIYADAGQKITIANQTVTMPAAGQTMWVTVGSDGRINLPNSDSKSQNAAANAEKEEEKLGKGATGIADYGKGNGATAGGASSSGEGVATAGGARSSDVAESKGKPSIASANPVSAAKAAADKAAADKTAADKTAADKTAAEKAAADRAAADKTAAEKAAADRAAADKAAADKTAAEKAAADRAAADKAAADKAAADKAAADKAAADKAAADKAAADKAAADKAAADKAAVEKAAADKVAADKAAVEKGAADKAAADKAAVEKAAAEKVAADKAAADKAAAGKAAADKAAAANTGSGTANGGVAGSATGLSGGVPGGGAGQSGGTASNNDGGSTSSLSSGGSRLASGYQTALNEYSQALGDYMRSQAPATGGYGIFRQALEAERSQAIQDAVNSVVQSENSDGTTIKGLWSVISTVNGTTYKYRVMLSLPDTLNAALGQVAIPGNTSFHVSQEVINLMDGGPFVVSKVPIANSAGVITRPDGTMITTFTMYIKDNYNMVIVLSTGEFLLMKRSTNEFAKTHDFDQLTQLAQQLFGGANSSQSGTSNTAQAQGQSQSSGHDASSGTQSDPTSCM